MHTCTCNCMGDLLPSVYMCSGGHLNPAVTVGVLVAGGINIVAALCYLVAQLVGGIVGAACVLVSLPCMYFNTLCLACFHTHTHTRTHSHSHMHSRAYTHTHTHTHTCTRTRMRAHIHSHSHTSWGLHFAVNLTYLVKACVHEFLNVYLP